MQKRAVEMPPGRFTKAARETWAAWVASEASAAWSPADWEAARRRIRLVDDQARTKDPRIRLKLAQAIRTGSRDLRLHGRKQTDAAKPDPHAALRERNRLLRAQTRRELAPGEGTGKTAESDHYAELFAA